MSDTVELVQALIRNACVNDGTPESGEEHRSVATLTAMLGPPERVYEPTPGRQSALFRVPGRGDGPSLMLMGHLDVVPVNPDGWSRDPFGGDIEDGFVWGRGAVDMLNLTGAMAVSFRRFLAGEHDPLPGDLLFLAVADEEAGGLHGAKYLVDHHWDEVGADYLLTEIAYPGIAGDEGRRPTVNVGEKGPLWRLARARGTPGHASQPYGSDNALVPMARAVAELADAPAPVSIPDAWRAFVESGAVPDELRSGLTDPDAVDAAIDELAETDPLLARYAHACTHMTITPTILRAGVKDNVIPDSANASFDVRALPGQDGSTFDDHARKVLGAAADRIEFRPVMDHPATASEQQGPLWESIGDAHQLLSGDRTVVPVLTPAATDARFWRSRGTVAYGAGWFDDRVEFGEFLSMFHGHDERVSVESLERTEQFLTHTVAGFGRRTE